MSPPGGQGINIAVRDALVVADHLCPPLMRHAVAAELDMAAVKIEAERMPEVATVQRMQQLGPWLLRPGAWLGTIVLSAPVLSVLRSAPVQHQLTKVLRRFAYGVTRVTLEV
jgi:2-polyprenyl-6-methoxyphenol hydroxylase-like FAD-dependent oxidoreductase